jgi:hypothetical protein
MWAYGNCISINILLLRSKEPFASRFSVLLGTQYGSFLWVFREQQVAPTELFMMNYFVLQHITPTEQRTAFHCDCISDLCLMLFNGSCHDYKPHSYLPCGRDFPVISTLFLF